MEAELVREPEWIQTRTAPWRADGRAYRGETYYGLPAVKPSTYGLKAATSYFAEGTGGASQILATITDLAGREEDRPLVRAGRYLALAGSLTAASLFIADLHTPSRWYNMLRIFRRTSPMSIGSWSLTSFGVFSALTAAGQLLEDAGRERAGRRLARAFEVPASLAGAMVSLYTGTELEETSLPLWAKSSPLLAPLFFSVNALSAISALRLATRTAPLSSEARRRLERMAALARVVEMIFLRRAVRRWKVTGGDRMDLPLLYRFSARSRAQIWGLLASLPFRALKRMRGASSPRRELWVSLAGLAAGLLLPAEVIFAGNSSGQRPEEYLTYTQPGGLRGDGESSPEVLWNQGRKEKKRSLRRYAFWGLGFILAGTVAYRARSSRKGGEKGG